MRALIDEARLREFMRQLGRRADAPGRVYLTGGAAAVLLGWRPSTIDIDLAFEPARLRGLFATVEPALMRYPAIDPDTLRRAVEEALVAG